MHLVQDNDEDKYFSYHFERRGEEGGEEYRLACCEIIKAKNKEEAGDIAYNMCDANNCDVIFDDYWEKEEALRTFDENEIFNINNYTDFSFEDKAVSV